MGTGYKQERITPVVKQWWFERVLRLLITERCNRKCEGCCNKDWDLSNLPICTDLSGWDLILLTGGEPMLYPTLVMQALNRIPEKIPVVLYTAYLNDLENAKKIFPYLYGLTITLHEQKDVPLLENLIESWNRHDIYKPESLYLNVFRNVMLPDSINLWDWSRIKINIDWIKNCPLPANETFMKWC